MSAPAVRFVVQVFNYWNRSGGHHYRCARVTSTITGKVLNVTDVGGDENITSDIARAFNCPPSDIALNVVIDVTRMEYQRLTRVMDRSENMRTPFAVTRAMLDMIETK